MSPPETSPPYCDCTRPSECIGRHPGRYLTAVYWLATDREGRLATGRLSDYLGVSPASVTEMIQKLAAAGLVDHEKHRGSDLTRRGEAVARELAWRQCIVRTFFASNLDFELDADTGYRIGHSVSSAGIRRLRERIDHPPSDRCRTRTCGRDRCLYGRPARSR